VLQHALPTLSDVSPKETVCTHRVAATDAASVRTAPTSCSAIRDHIRRLRHISQPRAIPILPATRHLIDRIPRTRTTRRRAGGIPSPQHTDVCLQLHMQLFMHN